MRGGALTKFPVVTTMVTVNQSVQHIQLRDAKARLSAVVDAAEQGTPSVITRHGKPAAVVLSYAEWKRLSDIPSFGALLAMSPLTDEDLPPREPWVPQDIES